MIRRRSVPRKKGQNRRCFARSEQLESRILLAADFGDAPDGTVVGGVLRNYPTLLANNGAQHNASAAGPFLGSSAPDMEANGQPNADATGDGSDENGIVIEGEMSGANMVAPGENFTATATIFGTGVVNVFVDWNIDGDWDDANEWIIQNEEFSTSPSPVPITIPPLELTAPADATPGTTFFRVRVSDLNVTGPGGLVGNGEVEDYRATIVESESCSLVVTTTADSGIGSLRDAITCANDTAGADTITFNISGTGPHTIEPLSPLPAITDTTGGTTIDGFTQTGASANTAVLGLTVNAVYRIELAGTSAGAGADGLTIHSSDNLIRGLAIGDFSGNGVAIEATETVDVEDNIIEGNLIGLNAAGDTDRGNGRNGVLISGDLFSGGNLVGGTTAAARNVISGNVVHGVVVEGGTSSNAIRGNYFGVGVSGTSDFGNGGNGVAVSSSSSTTIGGNLAGSGNVIGFNAMDGVFITIPGSAGNTVAGNFIGTDPGGTLDLGNVGNGVRFTGTGFNTVGSAPGIDNAENIIAFNGGDGIRNQFGFGASFFKSFLGNRIYDNDGLGINLVGGTEDGFGVTANDFQDPDTGSNNLQNYPVLTSAITSGTTIVSGTINTTPSSNIRLEFFSNSTADPSGHGEGETILGTLDVMTNANGDAAINFNVGSALADGLFISATATDLGSGDTSEFAANVITESEMQACSLVITTTDDVVNAGDGVNSLREAITCANVTPGPNTITVPTGIYDLDLAGAGEDGNVLGDLDILDELTIQSATGNAANVTISGGEEFLDRIFHIHAVAANITGIRIAGGTVLETSRGGGGIFNEGGSLTLTNSIVEDNFAPVGGGIMTLNEALVPATLNLVNTQVIGNLATGDSFTFAQGGGIYAIDDEVNITAGSIVSNNMADASFGLATSGLAHGGGMKISGGSLTIDASTVTDNEAIGAATDLSESTGSAEAGGIMFFSGDGTALITNSVVSNNRAIGADKSASFPGGGGLANGGGIYNGGEMRIENSALTGNEALGGNSLWTAGAQQPAYNGGWGWGGAIYTQGSLEIVGSSLSENLAQGGSAASGGSQEANGGSGWGGAVYVGGQPGLISLVDSTLSANQAIGGLGAGPGGLGGNALGGGLYSDARTTVVFNSTIDNNLAQAGGFGTDASGSGEGGGIWLRSFGAGSRADIVNSTVSNNIATHLGGGVYVGIAVNYNVQIVNTTIVLNEVVADDGDLGAGIFHDDTAIVTLNNTIVALNVQGDNQEDNSSDLFGSFGGANNLIGDGADQAGLVNGVNGNQVGTSESPIDPLIEALADNGGPTFTHALQSTSTAIEGGNNALAVSPIGETLEFDQRGEGFPRFVGGLVDIGAFEAPEEVCSLVVTHIGDSGLGSLREAINCANDTPGPDTVTFAISGAGPHTIQPLSELPTLLDTTGGTTIDGYSQAGAAENTNAFTFGNLSNQGLNTVLRIAIDGSLAGGSAHGLVIEANDNAIQGLSISGFSGNEIELRSDGNVVRGSFLGADVTGMVSQGDDGFGIHVNGGSGNVIGGSAAGDRNLLSGNTTEAAIRIDGAAPDGTTIYGNLIGTDITGVAALANAIGISMAAGASNTSIGGILSGAGNVISGNLGEGISIVGNSASGNSIVSNYIGTDVTGTAALGNQTNGISLSNSSSVAIGAEVSVARNVISGNDDDGVNINGGGSHSIAGNFIGTDVTGTMGLGNGDDGVDLDDSANNFIGGATAASRNLISGNGGDGVSIAFSGSTGNTVANNYIGTNVSGTAALGNGDDGVDLDSASDNFVLNNLISANEDDGVEIDGGNDTEDGDATGNVVQGNLIGTNFNGTSVIGNLTDGVSIQGASANLIGGSEEGQSNLISGNGFDGVFIVGFGASDNRVVGNRIGTDITGTIALGNEDDGVDIYFGPRDNEIVGNLISGNDDDGVAIEEADLNFVRGNLIGTALDGLTALGNGGTGISIIDGSFHSIGGSAESEGNVISGNQGPGVSIVNATEGNLVQGNRIGVGLDGGPLGNNAAGVELINTSFNLIGGINPGEGNLISANAGEGVLVTGESIENTILSNSIFANGELGIDLGGNGVTSNDMLDFDLGPNQLQNFPLLTSVSGSVETIVNGTLNSLPTNNYRIEFFSNTALDPSGFGEGQTFLGFVNVVTDSNGDASFVFNAGQLIPANQPITSTATRFRFDMGEGGYGGGAPMIFLDTSEFSARAPEQEVADLSLVKTVDVPAPEIGEMVTFTLTLENDGPNAATGVEVTDMLPAGLMFVSSDASIGTTYDEGTGIWTVGTIGVDAVLTLEIMVMVQSTEQITNRAEITASDQFDDDITNNFSTAGVGQCLYGLDGPLVVGLNRLVYTCPTPGSISAFVMGTEFGSFTFTQYNQTVEIDDPEVIALGVANQDGVAVVHVQIPATMANSQVIFQAFEMSPNPQLSNTLAMSIANIPLLASAGEGSGAAPIFRRDIEAVFAEAVARWQATDLSAAELARLESAQFRVLDLPDGLLGSALNTTIYLDRTAAGHGWFVDATPADDSEFELAVSAQERVTTTSPAGDRIDLLTVIMHELGHVLGHSDESPSNAAPGLMDHELATGTRRLPTDLPEADISRPLHNFDFAEDVNSDGQVTLGDALELISHLRRHGSERVGDIVRRLGLGGQRRLDVSGDNFVSLHDALMVVARMRNTPPSESEAAFAPSSAENQSASLAEGELEQPLEESAGSDYEAAVDAVLASYALDDEE